MQMFISTLWSHHNGKIIYQLSTLALLQQLLLLTLMKITSHQQQPF